MSAREITSAEAIREATYQAMAVDEKVVVIGEGVPDPKGIFGTTVGLREEFGSHRVFDMPVAENGMTEVIIGAALSGIRPVLTHQRVDFSLYSLDQIINNAAKWRTMFGNQTSVPIVIRMVIGRGWGQGAQHSQNLQALFAHIPGLKVVMPATAYDAKGLLSSAIQDNDPVIFLEHRWIHGLTGLVPEESYSIPLGKADVKKKGKDVTIVASSYMTIEAMRAATLLEEVRVSAEVVDLRTITPLDLDMITDSVRKTGRVVVVDSGWHTAGFSAEVVSQITEANWTQLKAAPVRIALPDRSTPSSPALTKGFYKTWRDIVKEVGLLAGVAEEDLLQIISKAEQGVTTPHDVPDSSFTGPF